MNRAASTRKPPPFLAPAAADQTTVHGGADPLPGTPRLLVTAGPGKGAELALGRGIATLGRGAENALVIADIAVSRRHARIEERASAWVVIDEGSGNGTRVNGARVREQRLHDGDEIAVGGTRVRFLDAGGVAAPDLPPRKPERARFLRARRALCAASLVLAVASGVHRWRTLEAQRREVAAREQDRALARQHLDRGVALLGAGQRQKAREELEVASELDGSDEKIRAARAALERKGPDAAVHLAAPAVPKPVDPPSAGPARPAPVPSQPARSLGSIAPPRARSRSAAPAWAKLERSSDKPLSDAQAIVAAYRRGDLAAARERAKEGRTSEAARLSAALKDFERACRQAATQQTPADALRLLEEAAAADRAIAGRGESRLGGEVRKALSAQHLLAAASLKSDDQLPQAAAHLRAAAEANPSNPAARDALRRLQERVHDLYLRGYVARETDPAEARRCFSLVVQALPAADETAQKAKRWLDKLEGKAAD